MEIKTKYNIGDKVWTMNDNTPTCITIRTITTVTREDNSTIVFYVSQETFADSLPLSDDVIFNQRQFVEHSVFPSKEELLKHYETTD